MTRVVPGIARVLQHRFVRVAIVSAGILAPLIPLGLIWIPPLRYYHVATTAIPVREATGILRSMNPSTCGEFTRFDILPLGLPAKSGGASGSDSLAKIILDSLKRGVLRLPLGYRLPFTPTFSVADFRQPDTYLQLNVAGLAVAKALVWAWQRTPDPNWLEIAHRYVDSWWAAERRSVLPHELQWNDHAVAARVMTLIQYLCAMRTQSGFSDSAAAEVLSMLATSGERLTKPDYFTFRTNHGIMQNVALLSIAASFPRLPQSPEFADTARARLEAQLPYYVGPEGVVFEHSSHYHLWGTALLRMVIRFYEALDIPVSADLAQRYTKAVEFSRQLLRLDGTLSSWGNTFRGVDGSEVPAELSSILDTTRDMQRQMRSRAPASWAPTSGVAVWWASRPPSGSRAAFASQTLVAWADFATQAHKHADDMSMLVWTDRSDIFIGSGYWPNDSPDYDDAYGWAGSNAPHFVGESGDVSPVASSASLRPRGLTAVRGSANSASLEFLDLERTAAGGGRLRRQIAFVRPDLWVVIDVASGGPAAEFETSWLLDPSLSVKPAAAGTSATLDAPSGPVAHLDFAGCPGGSMHEERGSRSPFSGWTAADGAIAPTTALRRRCPNGNYAAMVLRAVASPKENSIRPQPMLLEYTSPEQWHVRRASTGETVLRRDGGHLSVMAAGCDNCGNIEIRDDSGSNSARARVDSLYFSMQRRYTPFTDLLPLRVRMTKLIAAVWIAQVLMTLVAGPLMRRRAMYPAVLISALAIIGWLLVTLRLETAYFS